MKWDLETKGLVVLFLIATFIIFILESDVSLRTNIVFGDEGFHARMSQWIARNKEYPVWNPLGFTEVSKSDYARPPLFHMLMASFLFIFGNHEIILKLFPPFLAAVIAVSVYLLAGKLYGKKIGAVSAFILIALPSFVTYSVLTFDEMIFVFYFTLFILFFAISVKENSKIYWALSAVFAGITVLTKHAGIIIFPFVAFMFLYSLITEKKLAVNLKKYLAFGLIMLIITVPFFLRNMNYYNTPLCIGLPFFNAEGCSVRNFEEKYSFDARNLGGGSEENIFRFGLHNFVEFAYGNIWFVLIGFIGGLILTVRQPDKVGITMMIMMLFGLYILQGTYGRAEDAARQLLPLAPLMVIISAKYWNSISEFLDKYQKYLGLVILIPILFLGYLNITSKLGVMESVKTFSPSFFEACDWVKKNLDEDARLMTFWGHRAAYACQRTVSPGWADIRLNNDPEDIVNVAEMHGITHFFIQKFSISPEPVRESYSISFVNLLENNPDKFEKVYENGPGLDGCLQQGICDGNIIYKVVY